jgi:hypothetical protein
VFLLLIVSTVGSGSDRSRFGLVPAAWKMAFVYIASFERLKS